MSIPTTWQLCKGKLKMMSLHFYLYWLLKVFSNKYMLVSLWLGIHMRMFMWCLIKFKRLWRSKMHIHLNDGNFWSSYSCNPIPSLVEEVPDFKSFLEGYIPDKGDVLCCHKDPLQFRFLMIDGFHVMQYWMNPAKGEWKPSKGIKMWKVNSVIGQALFP